ncbi:MAG: tRNA pseudouridine synthase A [Candidatus Heimdallarchaeota archaeon LC_3]|nr:MAG: tRNA pseudouridine synthase A [Candidatus Heimdallarchaeota archaeon LC_3]
MFIALKLAYIGSYSYSGFQKQKDVVTIEEIILKSLKKAEKSIEIIGTNSFEYAGRTDKGVHAWDQTIKIQLKSDSIPNRFLYRLNAFLPKGIYFWSYAMVPKNFSPRHDAIMRHYSYFFSSKNKLDYKKILEGAKLLTGRHDFILFSKSGSNVKSTYKTINKIDVFPLEHFYGFQFKISAKSFLWQMVRRIAGHLIELGEGKADFSDTLSLLEGKYGEKPEPLPPDGLILEKIEYHEYIRWKIEKPIFLKMKNDFQKQLDSYIQKFNVITYFNKIQEEKMNQLSNNN